MADFQVVVVNRLTRLIGNVFKVLAYPFHWIFPNKRFAIPDFSKAKTIPSEKKQIPRKIWQTNYSNMSTMPMYMNYLYNRMMSMSFDYQYVSTEERDIYLKKHASPEVYQAYLKLNDGAAQADLWRLVVLNTEGGIYMDIDATLVWPLEKQLKDNCGAMYVSLKKNGHYTNYFIASAPNNPVLTEVINNIVDNINNHDGEKSVYATTGPWVLTQALEGKDVYSRERKYVCIQGSFTNEHFQYLDKPRGKWTHKSAKDIIKH
ncbi:glycosyltransferase [Vibrio sp. Hep-1b-8]|uniref:glycosyltransferase family 32 protein n=1 Tax=Vibrio sp. Hep-1b-8 TaxID=2144187 RepID=UPI0011100D95|nr:glycosyltransferase [Vibrio sp. Hep-1b-8]TMX34666.1 glycosyl transferase [Vibrio sp. Hep-1b-8]